MSPKRFTRPAALGLAVAAFAAPAAASALDLRSPDARTAAPAVHPKLDLRSPDARGVATERTAQAVDLRSPDARGVATEPTGQAVELRTPDSRDLGLGRGTAGAPNVMVVKLREPAPVPVADGLDWGDAGIGAAALLGIGALALGAAFAASHRRGRPTTA